MPAFPIQSGQLILCTGDSITDCGHRGDKAPYGDGYVSLLRESVIARHPERNIRWLNRGIGGNTVEDLKNRWEDDCLREQPDWLTIKIGINDLHQTLGKGPRAVDPKRFRELYRGILERVKSATKAKVVLIDPFYLSTDAESDGFRAQVLKLLPEYLDVVAEMATAFKTRHVKTQTVFEAQMKHRSPNDFSPEPVHPYRIGHVVIAEAVYGALCE
jgi:lysophospholipase L1-like esterase